jgi:hypothetical protein
MYTWNTRSHLALLVVAGAAALVGSATRASGNESPTRDAAQQLRERAQAYWEARIARSPRVHEFYAPPRSAAVSEGGNVQFTAFEIEGVEVRGDDATVEVRVQAHVALPTRVGGATHAAHVHEAWHRVGGAWYKRPVPPGFAPPRPTTRRETSHGEGRSSPVPLQDGSDAGSITAAP